MIGGDDVDLHVVAGGFEVINRHMGRDDRALPSDIRVEPGHVTEHADLDRLWRGSGLLRLSRPGAKREAQRKGQRQDQHRCTHVKDVLNG